MTERSILTTARPITPAPQGPKTKQYGLPADTCCCCPTKLSAYNPDPHCSNPACKTKHKTHECIKNRSERQRPKTPPKIPINIINEARKQAQTR